MTSNLKLCPALHCRLHCALQVRLHIPSALLSASANAVVVLTWPNNPPRPSHMISRMARYSLQARGTLWSTTRLLNLTQTWCRVLVLQGRQVAVAAGQPPCIACLPQALSHPGPSFSLTPCAREELVVDALPQWSRKVLQCQWLLSRPFRLTALSEGSTQTLLTSLAHRRPVEVENV